MRAWGAVEVPSLEGYGRAPEVRVHDTATERLVVSEPGDTATLYVCGVTPYDATHIGHAATYLAFDLLNRAWRGAGDTAHYVPKATRLGPPPPEGAPPTP